MAMTGTERRIPPDVLARIAGLKFEAQVLAGGLLSGTHRSFFQGASVEFAEHKEYVPGDEVRHIDWRVLAKSDRYYIKKYELEKNIRALFLVDGSGSMEYASQGLSKMDYAARMALGLAFLLLRQSDRAGLSACGKDGNVFLPPSSQMSHFDLMAETLATLSCGGVMDPERWLRDMADAVDKTDLILLFSDFFCEPAAVRNALKFLKSCRKEVLVFHVLDPAELAFPFTLRTRFKDMESPREIIAEPAAVKADYLARLKAFIAELRGACLEFGADCFFCDTAVPLPIQLLRILKIREGKS